MPVKRTRAKAPAKKKVRFCRVCFARMESDEETCSTACKRTLASQRRRIYDVRARRERWMERRFASCAVCGKRLTRPGSYCTEHRQVRKNQLNQAYRLRRKQREQATKEP